MYFKMVPLRLMASPSTFSSKDSATDWALESILARHVGRSKVKMVCYLKFKPDRDLAYSNSLSTTSPLRHHVSQQTRLKPS